MKDSSQGRCNRWPRGNAAGVGHPEMHRGHVTGLNGVEGCAVILLFC